jgi:hypothetical protein
LIHVMTMTGGFAVCSTPTSSERNGPQFVCSRSSGRIRCRVTPVRRKARPLARKPRWRLCCVADPSAHQVLCCDRSGSLAIFAAIRRASSLCWLFGRALSR